jgi:SM-20-related protein
MSMTAFTPQLNPALDRERAKAEYAFRKRVQLRDVFTPESAEAMHVALSSEASWGIAYWDDNQTRLVPAGQVEQLTNSRLERMSRQVQLQAAQSQFSFAHRSCPLWTASGAMPGLSETLAGIAAFFASADFVALVSEITSVANLKRADAEAMVHGPGHFRGLGDPRGGASGRIAYEWGLSKDWPEDWGGQLLIFDDHGDIAQGYRPRFNALTLYDAGLRNAIAHVAGHAQRGRAAIGGWAHGVLD